MRGRSLCGSLQCLHYALYRMSAVVRKACSEYSIFLHSTYYTAPFSSYKGTVMLTFDGVPMACAHWPYTEGGAFEKASTSG